MKRFLSISCLVALLLGTGGCRKGNPVSPTNKETDFPPDTKFSLTLYSPTTAVSVGDSFDVRVVLYNVTAVSGVALDVSYPPADVDVFSVDDGQAFFPPDSVISLSKIEPDTGRVEVGISYRNTGPGSSKSGSGVVCTFKCRAKAAGTASFVIDQNNLQITNPTGTLIDHFEHLLIEDLSVIIR